jgi:hypothetical protein
VIVDDPSELVRLSNGAMSVTTSPGLGSALVSLVDERSGREWLAQAQHPRRLGALNFGSTAFSGWDEMFPTITGDPRADHGDVWNRSWSVDSCSGTRLVTTVVSWTTGLVLTRDLSLDAAGSTVMTMGYRVVNPTNAPVAFLWAAHPQFRCPPGTLVEVRNRDAWWRSDPAPAAPEELPLRPLEQVGRGGTGKWWSDPEGHERWLTLRTPANGSLALRWSGSVTRWIGVWVDYEALAAEPVIVPEPATAWLDDVISAERGGRAAIVPAGGSESWRLVVEVGA